MTGPRLSHVLIFTTDLERMARFYAGAFGLRRDDSGDANFVMMRSESGAEVALHQVPPHIAAEIALTSPPRWRDDTAFKVCFEVDDLAGQRQAILDHGGQAKAPWSWRGTDFCECADVEGNGLQLIRRPEAAAGN